MRSGVRRRVTAFSTVVGAAALVAIGIALAPALTPDAYEIDREAAKAELRAHLEDIPGADILRFDVHDDRGFGIGARSDRPRPGWRVRSRVLRRP